MSSKVQRHYNQIRIKIHRLFVFYKGQSIPLNNNGQPTDDFMFHLKSCVDDIFLSHGVTIGLKYIFDLKEHDIIIYPLTKEDSFKLQQIFTNDIKI